MSRLQRSVAFAALLYTAGASATPPAPEVSQARQRADIEKLVSFGTRHTLSSQTDPKRGIGAARNWAAQQFEAIGRDCGGCIKVERISRRSRGRAHRTA